AGVCWKDKKVLLAPPSTIVTNRKEVWGEFFLARLLRERGADVKSLRLPPMGGRRRTLGMAQDVDWEIVEPPRDPWEAVEAADKASQEARRLDPLRRALPRKKGSPKLDQAISFVKKHNVERLTEDVVRKAKRRGITKATLRRALMYNLS